MSRLTLVSNNPSPDIPFGPQVAHDLRNLLATVGLHLETLQRLSGPNGARAADAAHDLLARSAALCNKRLGRSAIDNGRAQCKGVDIMQTARKIANLLAANAPPEFSFDIARNGNACVLADPDDVFRILFNLMNNAVTVARHKANSLRSFAIRIKVEQSMVTVSLADDGPGLPPCVRRRLFLGPARQSSSPPHGWGLAIARELAERNGGTLKVVPSSEGTTFELKMPALLSLHLKHGSKSNRRSITL
jgi:signal transduction histidine kinase